MKRIILFASLCLAGCAPQLAPLYQDFSAPEASVTSDRVAEALTEAGWALAATPAPGVVATQPRQTSHWGLYKVYVSVEVVPLAGPYVRVLFHPYREYAIGGRGKIPYLPAGIRRSVVPDIRKAFAARGLQAVLSGERAYRAEE